MTASDANLNQRHVRWADGDATKRANKTANKATRRKKLATIDAELKVATSSRTHRIWTRTVIIFAVMTLVYFYSKQPSKEVKIALARDTVLYRGQKIKCSATYAAEIAQFSQCMPKECGRFVSDDVVSSTDAQTLLELAHNIFSQAGSSGGASILDLHTGALSHGQKFVNAYKMPKLMEALKPYHLTIYNTIKSEIKSAIAQHFRIHAESLYLTYPTFFSRLTNATAKTVHDEYWHEHVDKVTYPSFHYTSLLYLNTYNQDYTGGRFIFVSGTGENRTIASIEPKVGRVSAFTSGAENPHYVEPVTMGERYAITISFTCDEKLAIADPALNNV